MVLDLTVLDTSKTLLSATICSGDSYSFGGDELIVGGIYRDTLSNMNGCDSILELTLNINTVTPGVLVGPSQTVFCDSGNPDAIIGDGSGSSDEGTGAGTLSYTWQSSTDMLSYNNISGSNANYNPGILSNDRCYRRITTSELNGVICRDTSNVICFSFPDSPELSATISDTMLCAGSSLDLSNMISGDLSGSVRYGTSYGSYPDTITTLLTCLLYTSDAADD